MSAVSKKKSDKKDKIILNIQRTLCYIVLIIISILCLFSFYVLLINTTRSHPDIQKGFSLIPGKSFFVNLTNLLKDKQLPVLKGMCNSLLVASGSAVLSVYFSALTAYAIHAYDFRFKKAAFTFIMVIMMVPTQVSALGFINQMSNMRLMNSFIPLIIPSIASPVVFFFIKQYMDSVLPMELVEAARIDGAHEFRIFNQIVLPLMKPAMLSVLMLGFIYTFKAFDLMYIMTAGGPFNSTDVLGTYAYSKAFTQYEFSQGSAIAMVLFACLFLVGIFYLKLLSKEDD